MTKLPVRPTALRVNEDWIPDKLKSLNNWVLWRYEEGENKDGIPTGKWIKKPYQRNGYAAKHNDPSYMGLI